MSNATPVPSKPWWQSKTVILNLVALVSLMLPPVREWLDGNTEQPLAALAALNLLVRFATQGKISLFPDDDGSAGGNATGDFGASGGKAGVGTGSHDNNGQRTHVFPWLGVVACAAWLLLLPGCVAGVDADGGFFVKPDPLTVDAGLKYLIRPDDSAKSGLTTWEYFDPETGQEIPEEDYAAWGIKH
jgi:hypothetical protein